MRAFARFDDWEVAPLAQRMAFSSFSRSVDDIWGRHIERPFWIVIMPGYTVPRELDQGDKDAMWITESLERPRVVWDGFCKTALFEIIRECFDPAGTSPFIKVVDAETKKVVRDNRDPEIMAIRPVRPRGVGPRGIHNHFVELRYWGEMLPSGDRTPEIYGEILSDYGDSMRTEDSYQRSQAFMRLDRQDEDAFRYRDDVIRRVKAGEIKLRALPEMGPKPGTNPRRAAKDRETPLLRTADKYTIYHDPLSIEDFRGTGKPASFYRAAAEKGRRRREREREEFARTLIQVEPEPDTSRKGRSGLTPEDVPLDDAPGFGRNPF